MKSYEAIIENLKKTRDFHRDYAHSILTSANDFLKENCEHWDARAEKTYAENINLAGNHLTIALEFDKFINNCN